MRLLSTVSNDHHFYYRNIFWFNRNVSAALESIGDSCDVRSAVISFESGTVNALHLWTTYYVLQITLSLSSLTNIFCLSFLTVDFINNTYVCYVKKSQFSDRSEIFDDNSIWKCNQSCCCVTDNKKNADIFTSTNGISVYGRFKCSLVNSTLFLIVSFVWNSATFFFLSIFQPLFGYLLDAVVVCFRSGNNNKPIFPLCSSSSACLSHRESGAIDKHGKLKWHISVEFIWISFEQPNCQCWYIDSIDIVFRFHVYVCSLKRKHWQPKINYRITSTMLRMLCVISFLLCDVLSGIGHIST